MNNRKIKIAHILEGFLGGTGTYLCTVLPQLVQKGFDVTLIGSTNRSDEDANTRISSLRESGIKVHIIPMCREINPIKDVHSFIIILNLLLKNKFDIIHTHCSKAGIFGRIAGTLSGVKLRLHTPHCFAFTRCSGKYKMLFFLHAEKVLGKLTTRLIAVSNSEADIAINLQIIPPQKCVIIGNGISKELPYLYNSASTNNSISKASLGINNGTRIVTTVCRLVEYKGIIRFLEAAAFSNTPNTMFLVAGDGEYRNHAEKYIKDNALGSRVKMLGYISEIDNLYAISDIVTLCSDAEAQPYVLLEAMRAKRPIVATFVPGNKDLISHNNTGLLVEPEPQKIANAIDELLSSEEKCSRYAENAYDFFCKNHTLEKQISELTQMYQSLVRETYNGTK